MRLDREAGAEVVVDVGFLCIGLDRSKEGVCSFCYRFLVLRRRSKRNVQRQEIGNEGGSRASADVEKASLFLMA